MGSHIEWIRADVGILRCGSRFREYGDKYDFACTVDKIGAEVEFKGGVSDILVNFFRERNSIRELLKSVGVMSACWIRKEDGKPDKICRYSV